MGESSTLKTWNQMNQNVLESTLAFFQTAISKSYSLPPESDILIAV